MCVWFVFDQVVWIVFSGFNLFLACLCVESTKTNYYFKVQTRNEMYTKYVLRFNFNKPLCCWCWVLYVCDMCYFYNNNSNNDLISKSNEIYTKLGVAKRKTINGNNESFVWMDFCFRHFLFTLEAFLVKGLELTYGFCLFQAIL